MNPDPEKSTFLQLHLDNGDSPKTTESDKPKFMDRLKHFFSTKWDTFSRSKGSAGNSLFESTTCIEWKTPQCALNLKEFFTQIPSAISLFWGGHKVGIKKVLALAVVLAAVILVALVYAHIKQSAYKPNYDAKYDVPDHDIAKIDEQIGKLVTELNVYDRYPPEDLTKVTKIKETIDSLFEFKKKHAELKCAMYNFDPAFMPLWLCGIYLIILWMALYWFHRVHLIHMDVVGFVCAMSVVFSFILGIPFFVICANTRHVCPF